ncbi:MAG: ABC transporter permease [Oscillospiraceae bacterium]|nr:ABC transporter permease [Oscillospiraceae bacterium]
MRRNPFVYYGKKLLVFLVSVIILSLAVFYISRLAPGDPLMSYYGERVEKMSVQEKEEAREKLGLNDAIHIQYLRWVENAFKGDFGISYKYKQSVTEVISQRIGYTLILGGIGFVLTFLGALLLGVLCAWYEDRWINRILCKGGTFLSCIPEFWMSLVLILVFAVSLHWLPSSGAYDVGHKKDILNRAEHLILPLVIVVTQHLWYYAYMIRNKLLEETRADYVLLGKSKGLSKREIMFKHCLRNVLPSYISLMAISVPHIVGGTYIVETVFSYPGIGALSYESARFHDYNLLMVLCMLTGILVILCNLVGRIMSEKIDPRIKANDIVEISEVTDL